MLLTVDIEHEVSGKNKKDMILVLVHFCMLQKESIAISYGICLTDAQCPSEKDLLHAHNFVSLFRSENKESMQTKEARPSDHPKEPS